MSIVQSLITSFDEYIDAMPVPAVEAVEALLTLLRNGEADRFLETMKGDRDRNRELLEVFKQTYQDNPQWFEEQTLDTCSRFRKEYLQAARTRLNSVTAFTLADSNGGSKEVPISFGPGADSQLLQVSVADDFISRLPGGVDRAERLMEWSLKEPFSEQADVYLSEACNCFLYGMDTACIVMCRTLLAELLDRRIPSDLLLSSGVSQEKDRTLGRLLDVVSKNRKMLGLHREVPELLRSVNEAGHGVLHQEPVTGHSALTCLQQTRKVVVRLLP